MTETRKLETVSEGDTARETSIRLNVRGRPLPVEPVSAILRIDGDTVTELTLTKGTATGEWYFRWTDEIFALLPASATPYEGQVLVTFDDDSSATFPTGATLSISVLDPI